MAPYSPPGEDEEICRLAVGSPGRYPMRACHRHYLRALLRPYPRRPSTVTSTPPPAQSARTRAAQVPARLRWATTRTRPRGTAPTTLSVRPGAAGVPAPVAG